MAPALLERSGALGDAGEHAEEPVRRAYMEAIGKVDATDAVALQGIQKPHPPPEKDA